MKEAEFAYRVRQALNEGVEHIDYKTGFRLEQARTAALARQRVAPATVRGWVPALQPALASGPDTGARGGLWGWMRGAGMVAPLVAMVIGFIAIYQWQHDQRISNLADMDFAVLLDEHPIQAYADRGFGVFLQTETHE
jgi:hypothetical protein